MVDIALVFALVIAGVTLLFQHRLVYGFLSLVIAAYLFAPTVMETLAGHWFHIAASKQASEVLFYLIIAVVVIALLGRSKYVKRSS